jgi:hypothetical protein
MIIGSEAHKKLFCESFIASHRVYKPEHLPFPELDQTALLLLQAVPFWDEALYTERSALGMFVLLLDWRSQATQI